MSMTQMQSRSPSLSLLRWLLLTGCVLGVLLPFVYLFINSIKLERDFQTYPPVLIPSVVTFSNYQTLFLDTNSPTFGFLMNSFIITATTTLISVATGALAAYGLARLKLPFHLVTVIALLFLVVRFYPKITTVLPYYVLMRQLKLLDTVFAITLAHVGLALPFVVWLVLAFVQDLPPELEQSAMLDGCGPWARFRFVVLPLITPGLLTAAILTAFLSWNEFLLASSLSSLKAKTLPIAVASFVTDKGLNWGAMSAMSVVIVLPMILFALFAQRYLVRGLTLGAIKE